MSSVNVGSAVGYLDLDITGFLAGLQTAQNEANKRTANMAITAGKKLDTAGQKLISAGTTLTKTVTLPITGAGAAIVTMSSSFESAMSKVKAISGASGKEFKDLNTEAQRLGATTAFSAKEVADGMTEMAKAGWSSSQIIAGMEGVLNAASASGENLATVSTIVADAITGFGLKAEDATKVADLLTQAANSGTIDIVDLGESFKYIAPVAKTMNLSIEDVTTALAAMSMAGIKGSQAGTSLRGVLARMSGDNKKVAKTMKNLGIEITNQDGSFKSLNTILAEMRSKFSGMTTEQKTYYATILAGQEGMSGLLSLLGLTQEEYDAISESMNNCNGVAKKTADTMLDNLKGQVIILKSALEGLAIQFGEAILPVLKDFVAWVQKMVLKLQELSPEQKEQIVKCAAVAAAIGPVLLIIGKLVKDVGGLITVFGKIPEAITKTKSGFTSLALHLTNLKEGFTIAKVTGGQFGASASKLGAALGSITAPIAIIIAIIAALVAAFVTLWKTNDGFRKSITETWNEIKETISKFCDGIVERLNALGFDFESITDVLKTIWLGFCDLVAPIFEGAFQAVSNVLSTVLGVITGVLDVFIGLFTGNWDQLWTGVKEIFGSIWDGIKNMFQIAINTIHGVADTICGWFGTTWNDTWQSISDFFVNIWNTIVSSVVNAWNSIVAFVSSIPTNVSNFFSSLWTMISAWFTNLIQCTATWFSDMIDKAISFLKDFYENWPYYLGLVIGFVIGWAAKMVLKAKETGEKFVENVVKFIKELPGKILGFTSAVINHVVTWSGKMKKQAKETGKNFIDNIIKFFKELPGKIHEWFQVTIEKCELFAKHMKDKAINAGRCFIEEIVTKIKELPGKIWEWLQATLEKCEVWVKHMKDKGKNAIQNLIDAVIEGAKAIPEKMAEIGKNIVDGVWKGIINAKDKFKEDVGKFFSGIVDGVKKGLEIHSPSRVMRDQVGKNIALGVIEGIKNETANAGKTTKQLGDVIIKQAKKTCKESLEVNKMSEKQAVQYWDTIVKKTKKSTKANAEAVKQYNKALSTYQQSLIDNTENKLSKLSKIQDVSAEKEASYWKKCLKTLKKGTYEYKVVLKNYNDAVEQAESDRLNKAEDKLKKLQQAKDWNAKKEADYWKDVLSTMKKGTSAYNDALEKYKEANKSLQDSIKQLTKDYRSAWGEIKNNLKSDVQQVVDEYNNTLKSRTSELKSQVGNLFSAYEFKQTSETKKSLKNNLKSQVKALDEWKEQMSILSKRVGDNNFIEEVRGLGIDSTEQIKLLNSMTDSELKEYLSLWKKRNKEANEIATNELSDYKKQCEKQIETLTNAANKQFNELTKTYLTNLNNLGQTAAGQSFSVGVEVVRGVKKGMSSQDKDFQKYLEGFFGNITASARNVLGIHSPSKVFADQVGKWLPAGMAKGFVSAVPSAMKDINKSIDDGIKKINPDEIKVGGIETFAKTLKTLYNDIAVFFEDIEYRLNKSISSMTDELSMLIDAGKEISNNNQDAVLGYIGYGGFVNTKETNRSNDSNDNNATNRGDTYNFYSQAKLSEVECRNEMIQAKKELALDF